MKHFFASSANNWFWLGIYLNNQLVCILPLFPVRTKRWRYVDLAKTNDDKYTEIETIFLYQVQRKQGITFVCYTKR